MRMWAKGTARATLLTASFVAMGAGPALADVSDGHGSVLGGNQVNAPISVPVEVGGNAVGVVGRALAGSSGSASVQDADGSGGGMTTSGHHSIGGGNQVNAPISAPINVCGNAVSVAGQAVAACKGSATAVHTGQGGDNRTSGRHSILGGNQLNAPVSAPVNVCGNSAALLGDAVAACQGGSTADTSATGAGRTSGHHSILGGNQVNAPVNAPVDVCGNAAAVLGDAAAGCAGRIQSTTAQGGDNRTSGHHSIGGGNQVNAPVNAPANVCGTAAGVLGSALGSCGADTTTSGYSTSNADCPPGYQRASDQRQSNVPVSIALPERRSAAGQPPVPGLSGLSDSAAGAVRTLQQGLPQVGGPPKRLPPKPGQLPPIQVAAAESQQPSGSENGALAALAIGGLLAASAAVVTATRRLRHR